MSYQLLFEAAAVGNALDTHLGVWHALLIPNRNIKCAQHKMKLIHFSKKFDIIIELEGFVA